MNNHIWLETNETSKKQEIVFDNDAVDWKLLRNDIPGLIYTLRGKTETRIAATEHNIQAIAKLLPNFIFDDTMSQINLVIDQIKQHSDTYRPIADLVDGKIELRNVHVNCVNEITQQFASVTDTNLLEYINHIKQHGIHLTKSVIDTIKIIPSTLLTKIVSLDTSTKIQVSPNKFQISDIIETINELNHWPMLVVLEENNRELTSQVTQIVSSATKYIPKSSINVFFRLAKKDDDFNIMVKENKLNNYIDRNTKLVFILRSYVPKALLKAQWDPKSALVLSPHDFGKVSIFMNSIPFIYHYSNSIFATNRRKAA